MAIHTRAYTVELHGVHIPIHTRLLIERLTKTQVLLTGYRLIGYNRQTESRS